MRTRWAEAWADWLKPGGELVTLMFPVEEEGRQGPPWPVPQQLYEALLMAQGRFRCCHLCLSHSVPLVCILLILRQSLKGVK